LQTAWELVADAVGDAAQAAAQSRAWAEAETLPDPAVPGSRSAHAWAERAQQDGAAHMELSAAYAQYSGEQAACATLAATQAAVMQSAYDTPTDGLAATEHGAIFAVCEEGDTFATTYRNDAGVAAVLAAFPSKAFIPGISNGTYLASRALP
jgi:hypothetical protein